MSELYKRIAELCEQRGISGYRLCKEIGIQPSTLTDLKMGRKDGMSAKTADKIASYFGVSVGYLLGTEEEQRQDEEVNKALQEIKDHQNLLYDKTKNATPEQLRAIAQMIDIFLGNSPD